MTVANSIKLKSMQFLALGDDPPGVRLELVHGEIAVSPSPSFDHSYIDRMLSYVLLNHLQEYDLGVLVGDVDTIFDEYNVRRPDILYISKARIHLRSGKVVNIAPDLCVEILSPSSATTDQVDKANLYAKHGVPHYWIVDPKSRTFEVYTLQGTSYELTQSARELDTIQPAPFSTLTLSLAKIWPPRQ